MSEKKTYSVSLLKESKIDEYKNEDESKFFEESIILLRESDDFFAQNDEIHLLKYFNEYIEPQIYENGFGEKVKNEVVKVIGYYEILDDVEFENFTEVFSRFIIGEKKDTPDKILKKYFS